MRPEELATVYTGTKAQDYDARRSGSEKWKIEQQLLKQFLELLPPESAIIDVPVGTGRLAEIYKNCGHDVTGVDISTDMLAEAKAKAERLQVNMSFKQGSIFKLPALDASVDCAVCLRFLNWISVSDVEVALRELSRVSRKHIIAGIRTKSLHVSPIDRFLIAAERFRNLYLSRKRNRNKINIHRPEDIQAVLAKLGLSINTSSVVNAGMRGTRYEILFLEKLPHT